MLIHGKNPTPSEKHFYDLAYDHWHQTWSKFQKDHENKDKIYGDNFTRQNEIGALFYEDQIVGMSTFDRLDLRLTSHREDSYFYFWPKTYLEELSSIGRWDVMVGSQFSLDLEFRKNNSAISWKDIVFGLVVKRFLHSDAAYMVGSMLRTKGMEKLAFRYGAEIQFPNVTGKGVPLDLVTFERNRVGDCSREGIQPMVNQIWHQSNLNATSIKIAA